MEQKKKKGGRKPTGRLVAFKTISIAGREAEIKDLKQAAKQSEKSVSDYVLTSLGIRKEKGQR